MLKKGSMVLSIWCVINFMLAFIISVLCDRAQEELANFAGGMVFQKLKLPA